MCRKQTQLLLCGLAATLLAASPSMAQTRRSTAPAGMTVTSKAYPTGNQGNAILMLDRIHPVEARVNEQISYTIRVRNLTGGTVENVTLMEKIPTEFSVSSISPEPTTRAGSDAIWTVGNIGPRQEKTVQITGSAAAVGMIPSCATVTFSTEFCSSIRIVEPQIALVKQAPDTVMLCDPIPYKLIVSNTGSGAAQNVVIEDQLPPGITTADGKRSVVMNAGTLPSGQSREFAFSVRAADVGTYTNTAVATEAGGQRADASATTRVIKPILTVSKTCPSLRYLGRPAQFDITVRNDGDAEARNVMLTDRIPAGLQFLRASDGGQMSAGLVNWNVGTLQPGDSRTVTVDVNCTTIGSHRNTVVAKSYCSEASAECTLEVRGVPALLLECIDVEDPIEVGKQITYIITVLNQGTSDGTNIVIEATLPGEETFVAADGPVSHRNNGQVIRFEPLPSLAPKASVKYRVVATGVGVGDVRFSLQMTSDQLTSPVNETESTNIY